MIKQLQFVARRWSILSKISRLDIETAGIDSEGDPFVKLREGYTFFGALPRSKDRKFYNLLSSSLKKKIPFECLAVAMDIVIRYQEGGLKYGGPAKNSIYEVKKGDCVAEMGGYMGYYSMKMAKVVGSEGRVIAIEPMPNNLRILQKNIQYNQITNCTVVPKGVWKEKSTLHFSRKEGDNQSGSALMTDKGNEKLEIPVDSLDNILQSCDVSSCDQMIIQLNGVEIEALMGMQNIKPAHIAIAARYDREGVDTIYWINTTLQERGYKTKVLEKRYVFAELA